MKIYLVGGAVRDELLGLPIHERDYVVVGATPEQMQAQGFKPVGRDFPVFLHPVTHEEYALARTERKQSIGHQGFSFHTDIHLSLEDDLKRRDLTINAIAKDEHGQLIDPFGGLHDMQAKTLRHVSPAFAEDPLRVLRVARFAARFHTLGFHIAPETTTYMRNMIASGELQTLSPERLWMEIYKVFAHPSPDVFFQTLNDLGALAIIAPELHQLFQSTPKSQQATLYALHRAQQKDATLLFALLCHRLKTPADARRLGQRLGAPKQAQDIAQLLIQHIQTLATPFALEAASLFHLFTQTDAWRRTQRFYLFLNACRWCFDDSHSTWFDFIEHALQHTRHVSAQPLIEQGLQGQALGQALAQTKRAALHDFYRQNTLANNHNSNTDKK